MTGSYRRLIRNLRKRAEGDKTMAEKRTFAGEMEWALQQINSRMHDRNPNRHAQLQAAVNYGLAVALARRCRDGMPERPDLDNCF